MRWIISIPTDVQPRVGEVTTLTVTGRVRAVRVNPQDFYPIIVDLEVQSAKSEGSEDNFMRIFQREPTHELKVQPQWTGGGET